MKFNPCPFCGETNFNITPKKQFKKLLNKHGSACICVRCQNCELDMYEHTDGVTYEEKVDRLTDKWNRRAENE